MKVVVTGGSGFVGSFLVDDLLSRDYEVTIFDIAKPKYGHYKNANYIEGSVTDELLTKDVINGSDAVFHLSGLLGTHELIDAAYEATFVNICGAISVMEACIDSDSILINVSKPNCWLNPYTITKIAAESYIEMFRIEKGLKAATVKWFNVYGGRQPLLEEKGYKKAVPTWIVNALKGDDLIIYGDGTQTMDLVYTSDSVSAVLSVLDNWNKCVGEKFDVGSGEEISANDLAKIIIQKCKSESKIKHVAMRPGETEHTQLKADITKIEKYTNWQPHVILDKGLEETINWYRKAYNL